MDINKKYFIIVSGREDIKKVLVNEKIEVLICENGGEYIKASRMVLTGLTALLDIIPFMNILR